jgi:hypothetical protein
MEPIAGPYGKDTRAVRRQKTEARRKHEAKAFSGISSRKAKQGWVNSLRLNYLPWDDCDSRMLFLRV